MPRSTNSTGDKNYYNKQAKIVNIVATYLLGVPYMYVELASSGILVGLSFAFAYACFGIRFAILPRIVVSDVKDYIKVVNIFHTHTILWEDVGYFDLVDSPILSKGVIELTTGRRIRLWGIQGARGLLTNSTLLSIKVIKELNKELEKHTGRVPPIIKNYWTSS